jgi:hypothetical protein
MKCYPLRYFLIYSTIIKTFDFPSSNSARYCEAAKCWWRSLFLPHCNLSGCGAISLCERNLSQTTPSAAKIHFVLGRSRNYIFSLPHLCPLRIWSSWDGNPESWCGFLQNVTLGLGMWYHFHTLSLGYSCCQRFYTILFHMINPYLLICAYIIANQKLTATKTRHSSILWTN